MWFWQLNWSGTSHSTGTNENTSNRLRNDELQHHLRVLGVGHPWERLESSHEDMDKISINFISSQCTNYTNISVGKYNHQSMSATLRVVTNRQTGYDRIAFPGKNGLFFMRLCGINWGYKLGPYVPPWFNGFAAMDLIDLFHQIHLG